MSLKNKMQVNDLNKTVFKENYKMKRNAKDVELMETIENLSDDIGSNNFSYDSNESSKIHNRKNNDKSIDMNKKDNIKNNNKQKNVPNYNKNRPEYYSNVPQIYETYDTMPKDEGEVRSSDNSGDEENNFLANTIAIVYIIIAIVIILHLFLNEEHVVIKTISLLKLKFVDLIKSIPMFKNVMRTVSITNTKINGFLDMVISHSNILKPYMEALKELNTEFSILFIILILMLFFGTFVLHIVYSIITMKSEKDMYEKNSVVYVTNKMTTDEYEDRSFTYSELSKLHDDKDYICLKNKRAGEGMESWNWQMRKNKYNVYDKDICSDIELTDIDN
ncbi:hypothetical protein PGSY75_1328300 [Plasmodium gaboni]|uniref:Uncharacterized protein n=1 Tax=Plasmodium gaboni TaxID=647221 RepID=A0A151LDR3_9APIC|nr:hypothetical protein PGSY75_1328300 [Plasmodium gaboni]KYN97079.1 hypothetical protein PGSY75_1328300 [Plasmodium gaboni]